MPIDHLPKIIDNEITKKKLIGFKILDINKGELGKIKYINSQTAQQLIYVSKDGNEFCFPMHDQFIVNINAEERIMKVKIPKELINLNS